MTAARQDPGPGVGDSIPPFSDAVLADLAVRAATLDERLSPAWRPIAGAAERADARLEAWRQAASAGDPALFERRLARDGLSLEAVLPRLGALAPAEGAAPPAWIADAAWIGAALCDGGDAAAPDRDRPLPFQELFLSLVAAAERRRDALLPGAAAAGLLPPARDDLRRQLLAAVTELCAGALYEGFAARRQEAGITAATAAESSSALYEAFLAATRAGGFAALFEAKPVLLRLLAVLVRQWIEATAELLGRLHEDRPAIVDRLLDGRDPGALSAVESGLSDPHRGGRGVCRLRFADGRSLIYKPKDLAVDAAWAGLLDWLNARRPPIDLRAGRVLPREGYGWAECIEPGDCADEAAAERFFRRAGALLCLFHLLSGSDMHEENLIAAGEQPVAIDLEMLLQALDPARLSGAPALRAPEIAAERLLDSLLTTGLLPSFVPRPDTGFATAGGLAEGNDERPPAVLWRHPGSDAMTPYRGSPGRRPLSNLPRLEGVPLRLAGRSAALRHGCADYFRFLQGLKVELLAEEGPLAAFASVAVRRVLRPTAFYWLLLQRLRDHRRMDDGGTWSAQADFVARLADWDREEEPLWPLLAAERRALTRLDIPHFVHPADGDGLVEGGEGAAVAGGLTPGLAEARRRIAALGGAEIERQLEVLRLATIEETFPSNRQATAGPLPAAAGPPLAPDAALAAAGRIAARLAERAIRTPGSAAWIGLEALADGGGWRLAALGDDLYGGTSGIALFLAAHARLTADEGSRGLALDALAPLRHRLASRRADHLVRVTPLGGAEGLGSMIYALSVTGRLLDEPALIEDARGLALRLGDRRIAADRTYDVIGGAAGCILGLLRLYRDCGDPAVLDRAVACGRHLLASRPAPAGEDDPGLWRHLEASALTGFSHGAAGFAYALAALAKASGEADFAAAARDCLAYERRLFSPEQGNWPDLRESEPGEAPAWPCQWCHGAAGIGLARLGTARFGEADSSLGAEVAAAVATVRRRPLSPLDTLCCGNLGNAELLAEAARLPDNHALGAALAAEASAATRALLERAEASGSFGWNAAGDDDNLGLFRGLAGIGYALLRRTAPETLPNLLIWE